MITDELGMPVHPEWYSDEFGRLLKRAGLRRITLHDSRHTTLTLMEHAGVPISIISKWAGHYDSAFTQRTYVHASDDDLRPGRQASPGFTRSLRRMSAVRPQWDPAPAGTWAYDRTGLIDAHPLRVRGHNDLRRGSLTRPRRRSSRMAAAVTRPQPVAM